MDGGATEFPYFCAMFIDTHTHLYLEEFDTDREEAIRKAIGTGVSKMLLPNIDSNSWEPMLALCSQFPKHCFPMAGLHPTSVQAATFGEELMKVEDQLANANFVAIGEIGIDLYWDKTYQQEQEQAFRHQLKLAKKLKLPVAIHMRNSFDEVWSVVKSEAGDELTGVFHCFSGNLEQARLVTEAGFYLGIGGVVTFKNSGLQEVITALGPNQLLLETDAPYLAPMPHRGKRNESSYIPLIASKIAELTGHTLQQVAEITTANATRLFRL